MFRARSIVLLLGIAAASATGCDTSDRVPGDHGDADSGMDAGRRMDAGHDAAIPPRDAGYDAAKRDSAVPTVVDAGHDAAADDDSGPGGPLVRGLPVAEFFADSCGGCHGQNREGGTCPTLIPSRFDKPKSFYADTIDKGRPGTLMPAWGSLLTDEEIAILVDFLFTAPVPSSAPWELDDIKASRSVLIKKVDLPASPMHTGNLDNLMLVTERESRKFAVIDGDTHTVLGHVDSSFRAHGYAFHPKNKRWIYNMGRDGWLFKVDLYSLKPVIAVRVGFDSRGLAVSDDGNYIIAGNFLPNTAVILEADTLQPLTVIHATGVDPDGVLVDSRVGIVSDVSPALVGPYFIIGLEEAGQVWRIDWSKPDFPIAKVTSAGRILHDGFLTHDNARFFIASQKDNWMAAIDVATWKLVDVIPTGIAPHPGSGATWLVGNIEYAATVHIGEGKVTIWNAATGNIVGTVPTAGPGLFIRSTDKSPYIWADSLLHTPSNAITVFDGQSPTFDVVATITDGTQTLHPEFTSDGAFAYVADWKENVVRVYSTTYDSGAGTFPLVATIDDIEAPTGIFSSSRRDETLGH